MSDTETTSIEALILANHVEGINGLLYISGGGWTDHHRHIQNSVVPPSHFGVGVSIRVPWHATNEDHTIVVEVQNEDSTLTIARAEGTINVGRPAQLTRGDIQHAVIAMNVDTIFPQPGGYRVIATLDGDKSSATWPFRVHDVKA